MLAATDIPDPGVVRLARGLHTHRGSLLSLLGTALLAVGVSWYFGSTGGWPHSVWPLLLSLIGLGLSAWGSVTTSRTQAELDRLQARLREAQSSLEESQMRLGEGSRLYQNLWNGQLALLCDRASLGSSARISIYRHSGDSEEFHLLARYSVNPELAKRGRASYPDDQGCLARAWQEREFYLDDLPDPATHLDQYIAKQELDFGIPKRTLETMKMRSRAYFGYRIDGAEPGQWLAVLMIESEDRDGLQQDGLKKLRKTIQDSPLASLVDFTRAFEPNLDLSSRSGY